MQDFDGMTHAGITGEKEIKPSRKGLKILIDKVRHTLTLQDDDGEIKRYHIETGIGGIGDKEVEGDGKTPEGLFYITDKRIIDPPDCYLGSRWLGLSYPNAEDAERGLRQNLIDTETYEAITSAVEKGELPPQHTALGGEIGIHGGHSESLGNDWTLGCIGLADSDIEEFFNLIDSGTAVIIK